MKKQMLVFHILYYILFLLCYIAFAYVSVRLMKTDNLGAVIARTFFLVYVMTPTIILALSRFSLLRWYVDPIAAAIVPLFFYVGMVANKLKHSASLGDAFAEVNGSLSDAKVGWLLLIALFLFGLLASFSPARKNGKSISYKLLDKITAK